MIKVEEQSRGYIATRGIGCRHQNALFADIRTADDVRESVRFVRPETPEAGGRHGAASRRINVGSNVVEWVKAMNDAVLAFMIEKKSAVDNLEEILSVKGSIWYSSDPANYSVSIGKPGQGSLPEVVEAHHKMIKMAIKMGVRPRVEINGPEDAKPYLEMGVRDFAMGWDNQDCCPVV